VLSRFRRHRLLQDAPPPIEPTRMVPTIAPIPVPPFPPPPRDVTPPHGVTPPR
jgi:hypothetical protein